MSLESVTRQLVSEPCDECGQPMCCVLFPHEDREAFQVFCVQHATDVGGVLVCLPAGDGEAPAGSKVHHPVGCAAVVGPAATGDTQGCGFPVAVADEGDGR